MEALWNVEDKLKVTTGKAIALFACTSLLVVVICLTIVFRKKTLGTRVRVTIYQEPITNETVSGPTRAGNLGRCLVVRALMRALRWSGPKTLRPGSQRSDTPTPLLGKKGDIGGDVGWQSNNSTSAVWKKPILMGEKCEFPRFSGLILYDERGVPLHQCDECSMHRQEKSGAATRSTTLRDAMIYASEGF